MHGNYSITRGAFCDYVIADVNTTIKYDKANFNTNALELGNHPSNYINTFEGAASVTLGLSTVILSLHYHLGIKADKQANSSNYILIWGGSGTTGRLAIQIAKLAYGLRVITTSSPNYHDVLRSLGADDVFDYKDPDVVEKVRNVGGANILYALDAVSTLQTFQAVYDATSETKNAVINNLLFLELSEIKTDSSRKVTSTTTLVDSVNGEDANYGGNIIRSSPE